MEKGKITSTEYLKAVVLELANLDGYEKPSTYLEDLRIQVDNFLDENLKVEFKVNITKVYNDNISAFWNELHIKDFSNWLSKI